VCIILKQTCHCLFSVVYMACVLRSEKTCPGDVDAVGIHWPMMPAGYIALHSCPPGMAGWRVRLLNCINIVLCCSVKNAHCARPCPSVTSRYNIVETC